MTVARIVCSAVEADSGKSAPDMEWYPVPVRAFWFCIRHRVIAPLGRTWVEVSDLRHRWHDRAQELLKRCQPEINPDRCPPSCDSGVHPSALSCRLNCVSGSISVVAHPTWYSWPTDAKTATTYTKSQSRVAIDTAPIANMIKPNVG